MNSLESLSFGIGPSPKLSLRVSVAALAKVLFKHPENGEKMLALERKATLSPAEGKNDVIVKAQPFGGAVQIKDPFLLRDMIGEFRFDSERSRSESDFRIFIQPEQWPAVRNVCVDLLRRDKTVVLDPDPHRELVEEFFDTLEIQLTPDQFSSQSAEIIVEDRPSSSQNTRAHGYPTVRVYRVYETWIEDVALAKMMVENSETITDRKLMEMALSDAKDLGRGRANAVLALPHQVFVDHLSVIPLEKRNEKTVYKGHVITPSIFVLFAGIANPKYRSVAD